jgi:hypothetical protein
MFAGAIRVSLLSKGLNVMTTATRSRKSQAKKPVHEVRVGRVKGVIWENETEKGVRHNVTLRRIYVDTEGKWQSSDSFGRDDLLLAAKVLDLAHSWIFANSQTGNDDAAGHEEGGAGDHF